MRTPTEVVGDHHALGEIAVERTDLVVRRSEKAIVEKWLRREGMLDPGHDDALVQVGREGVPVGARRQHKRAALGRVRVDIVEVLEIGRVFELAEKRHAVLVRRLRDGERRAECDSRCQQCPTAGAFGSGLFLARGSPSRSPAEGSGPSPLVVHRTTALGR